MLLVSENFSGFSANEGSAGLMKEKRRQIQCPGLGDAKSLFDRELMFRLFDEEKWPSSDWLHANLYFEIECFGINGQRIGEPALEWDMSSFSSFLIPTI